MFDQRLRQQVRRVAFSVNPVYISNIFSRAPVRIPALFHCDLVAHIERFGHIRAALFLSEWKAEHRFASLPVRQMMCLCLHVLTAFCLDIQTW